MSWYFVEVCSLFSLVIAYCLPYTITSERLPDARMIKSAPNVTCDFETTCSWKWSAKSIVNVSVSAASKQLISKFGEATPSMDGSGNDDGHYLLVVDTDQRRSLLNITSPEIDPHHFDENNNNNNKFCTLSLSQNVFPKDNGNISVLIQERNTTTVIAHHLSNDDVGWQTREINLGHRGQKFRIVLEIDNATPGSSFVAIDNIKLKNCFPEIFNGECRNNNTKLEWTKRPFHCANDSKCILQTEVCDIKRDCSDGMDEKQSCDLVPAGTKCTFENGWCGWQNVEVITDKQYKPTLKWRLITNYGHMKNKNTGPNKDHTYGNETGTCAYVNMSGGLVASLALMESVWIHPPPPVHSDPNSVYRNSCYVTFFYHKYGRDSGSLALNLKEETLDIPRPNLWWNYGNQGDNWFRRVVTLPNNITKRYKIQFEARRSLTARGDMAVDDISFSPACFGIGIPAADLNGYRYGEYPQKKPGSIHPSFLKKPLYKFTTCDSLGARGPSKEKCEKSYNNSVSQVEVLDVPTMVGFQKWIVPETSFYTIIAKGARGGKGADGLGETRSAMVRIVTELHKGQAIYMLVGQEGQDACKKMSFETPSCATNYHFRTVANTRNLNFQVKISDGGGGGGGGTYVFTMENGHPEPLLVAAGSGGLPHGPYHDYGRQHGRGINTTLPNITAPSTGHPAAGAGGGWRPPDFKSHNPHRSPYIESNNTHRSPDIESNNTHRSLDIKSNNPHTGQSLLEGGIGGRPCYNTSDQMKGTGGFGGGGGGCIAGGGGGGFTGGRSWSESSTPGEGGWSMMSEKAFYKEVKLNFHNGPGSVVIIPAVSGCNCAHRCIAMDESRTIVKCICSPGSNLAQDGVNCISTNASTSDSVPWGVLAAFLVFICVVLLICIFCIYRKYLQQKSRVHEKLPGGARFPLNPLPGPHGTGIRLTDNQIYEFGGQSYTIRDLREIPREKVQLVRQLGCGAFGDVYQGLLRNRDTDSVDLAVAVKILPALSSNQAEADFLMEALIMSKFKHPNIVHFIGACFDTHPRYIILELLGGGDLKNFLRENRPKVDKPAGLTMKDLLQCAIDVAKGCQYLEELRFVHRDIAARNCLLTSRGPGRVVKIADFGMSRDIYRSDYYKKEGKAMLPIKWMPPEAFLDGLFSSKTDVWSFGVLLWEVMSLGFMPYTGIRNREVMMYVARGARLGAPANCPPPVFAIMSMCWSHDADERPTFRTIIERLGYCIQDPSVINTQLPVYKGPLPEEIDKTLMRSSKSDEDYIQTDYMIPRSPAPVEWNDKNLDVLPKYDVLKEIPTVPLPMEGNEKTSPNLSSYDECNDRKLLCNNKTRNQINVNGTSNQNRHGDDDSSSDRNSDDERQRSEPFILSGQYVKDPRINYGFKDA